jgi:hypothetical protein
MAADSPPAPAGPDIEWREPDRTWDVGGRYESPCRITRLLYLDELRRKEYETSGNQGILDAEAKRVHPSAIASRD